MNYIHSKDIFYLLRESLKLFDRRPIVHGGKVAYYVYMMMKQKGGFEKFELADIVFLTTFHDIGAYKTEDISQMLRYETKDSRAHSLYGHLFMGGMTSLGELSKVFLYHHADYATLSTKGFSESELASYICLAEAIDIYKGSIGDKFNLDLFKKQVGTKYSPEAFEMFCEAQEEYDLFERVNSMKYKQETSDIMDYFILTNEDKDRLLKLLMFTLGLKSDIILKNAAMCVALCEKMGILMKLNAEQQKTLVYAAYLHDIGYLAINKEWLENPTKLNPAQLDKLAQHTLYMEQLLKDKIKRDVIVVAAAHHERIDGKGYPRRLTEKQMNLSQLILQFTDSIAGAIVAMEDKKVTYEEIKRQSGGGNFSGAVGRVFLDKFEEIVDYAAERSAEILKNINLLNAKYEKVKGA